MVDGVPRGVDRHPLPTGQLEALPVHDPLRRRRRAEHAAQGPDHEPAAQRGQLVLAASPRRLASPRHRPGLGLLGRVVPQRVAGVVVGVVGDGGDLLPEVEGLGGGRRDPLGFEGRLLARQVAAAPVLGQRPGGEGAVGDELRCRLPLDPPRAAEVVGVRVGDDDGVDVADLEAGLAEAGLQGPPRRRARQPGIDHRQPPVVKEPVGVDVAQSRHPDRQLHPDDVGSDLGDLLGGRFLLLFSRPGRCRRRVARPTRDVGHALILFDGRRPTRRGAQTHAA